MAEGGGEEKSPIFISYAANDAETANAACRYLESRGVTCWIAPRDVKPGAQYADAIVRAINEATAVVVVMSASAMASSHVRREVERAAAKHKQIIAFRIDAAAPNPALVYFLSESQWIDVSALGMQPALARLASAVDGEVPAVVGPPPAKPLRLNKMALGVVATAAAAILAIVGFLIFGWPREAAEQWRDPLAATANGARLVATVANSRSDLWRVKFDSNGPPQNTAEPVVPAIQSAFAPRFGPDYLAYVSSAGGRRGIWKLANGTATELWNDVGADRVGAPAISPDGRRIAFTVESQDKKQLYVINSDGGRARVIGTTLAVRGDLSWAPDSQSIVSAIVGDGGPRVARILLDGSPPQPMVSEYSVDAAWSPDGKYFVYSGADVGTTFPLRAAGPDGRPYGMASLILTRGARRVAFARSSGSLVILRGGVGHKNFWLVDPRTGAERQLTDLPSKFEIGDFDVSPDSTQIIFDRVQDSSSIALLERTR